MPRCVSVADRPATNGSLIAVDLRRAIRQAHFVPELAHDSAVALSHEGVGACWSHTDRLFPESWRRPLGRLPVGSGVLSRQRHTSARRTPFDYGTRPVAAVRVRAHGWARRSHSPLPGISWAGSVLAAARPVRRPAVRRQGIARRLVETIQQAASHAGALRLSLHTEPDNAAALALYRQCDVTINVDLATLTLNIARWRSACRTTHARFQREISSQA